MGGGGIEIVARTIEVHRKKEDGVEAVLLPVSLGLHQKHFFGKAVRGVGLLGIPVPKVLLLEGNRSILGIGADGSDGYEFLDPKSRACSMSWAPITKFS